MPKSRRARQRAKGLIPTNKYQNAVLKKEELSDWYGGPSPALVDYFSAWKQASAASPAASSMPIDRNVNQILDEQRRRTDMAHVFYLTTDMAHLIHGASQRMPPYLMSDTDFPTSHGFLWLETPLRFSIVDDRVPVLVRAITWTREGVGIGTQNSGPGVLTWEYSDAPSMRRHPDLQGWPAQLFETPLFPVAYGTIRDGRVPWMCYDTETAKENPAAAARAALQIPSVITAYKDFQERDESSVDVVPIPQGSEVTKVGTADGHWEAKVPEGNIIHFEPDQVGRLLQAFFLFMQQEIPSMHIEPMDLPHPMLKRFKDKSQNTSPISIVTWRRKAQNEYASGTGREISYSYVRRDYWKVNNFRTIAGKRVRYPIWIPPTLVRPDLPFRDREVVNVVRR